MGLKHPMPQQAGLKWAYSGTTKRQRMQQQRRQKQLRDRVFLKTSMIPNRYPKQLWNVTVILNKLNWQKPHLRLKQQALTCAQ
jgi:hypothetical protein